MEKWRDDADPRIASVSPADSAWWQVFDDPVLHSLIVNASRQNLTLREAGYRILEARSQLGVMTGNRLPQFQVANGSYRRQQLSLQAGIQAGGAAGLPGVPRNFDVWAQGGQLAWEVDVWGRFRRSVEAADAELNATIGDYDHLLVLLQSDVAGTYIEIRTLEQRLEYARSNVQNQNGSLGIAQEKLETGCGSQLDVAQAETNLARTEAILPDLETQLRQAQNRLCVLLGAPIMDLSPLLEGNKHIPRPPVQAAIGIPAELLRRRADVRSAERKVAAQSARIGIAKSDLYPAFKINGAVFVQAQQFNNMLSSSAMAGNVGPSFSWNIFNYNRIQNNVAVEESRFLQSVAHYQNTVLSANREAEDAVVAYLRAQDKARILRKGVEAAVVSRDLTNELYNAGKTDFGRVFFAEYFLMLQQDILAQAEGDIARGLVNVYRALGGGWQFRPESRERELPGIPASEAEELPATFPLKVARSTLN